jgi:uncharacterized protein
VSEQNVPTQAEALNFLLKANCSESVIEHCKTVSKFAVKIAKVFKKKGFNVDVQLVEVGALLHDIGRSKTHKVDHGKVGGEIARTLGLPNSVVQIIERHVGGGITKEEAENLDLPAKDYLPQTLEEKIVSYADKRVEHLSTVPIEQALKAYIASLGENHPAINRIKKLHEEIVAIVGDPL